MRHRRADLLGACIWGDTTRGSRYVGVKVQLHRR